MIGAGDPVADPERLAALRQLILLDTPVEAAFDRLSALAARVLRAPVALVALVDEDRQFFKSCVGLPEPWVTARQTPLSHSFCQHEVRTLAPLVIEDARAHPLVCDNLAVPDLGVVAYLGVPLVTADGHALGSFCVIDHRPRAWTAEEIATLTELTASVMTEIELRAANAQLAELDRLREEFVASISHELRTPLTAARAALRLVGVSAADRLRDDERALLDNGRRSTERLGRLIDGPAGAARSDLQDQPVGVAEVDALEVDAVVGPGDRYLMIGQPALPLEQRLLAGRLERDVVRRANAGVAGDEQVPDEEGQQ